VVNLVRGAGPHVRVALEEGTQAQWLHDLIAPVAEAVIVCNTRGRSEVEQKSDQIDADRLSELLRLGGAEARVSWRVRHAASFASAFGNDPHTSPSPPVLAIGEISAVGITMRIRSAVYPLAQRGITGYPRAEE